MYFVVCKCFQFGQGQIFVIWERVNQRINPFSKNKFCKQHESNMAKEEISCMKNGVIALYVHIHLVP